TSTNQISNQSIQLSIDGFHTPVTVSNGGDRSAMLTKGGNVSTIKLNNPNSQTLYVTFTMTYNSNIKTYNLRVITDTNSSSIIVPTTTCTDLATDTFRSTFGIQFNRISTSANTNLSGACPRTSDNEICIGGISQCGLFCDLLKSHHKSAERIINIDKASSSEYVLRFVNYRICADDWSHKEVGGIAYVKERNTLVSYKSMGATYAVFAVQHELGHNLGVSEHCNGNNQNCVMKTGPDDPYALKGKWCTSCSTAIFDNK
ncbi:MAG: hypothetical protein FWF82_06695, partial [Oscillospiraceae bacterium]|nr:hypothetical protein [Oscillospiraceae bacterium]